MQATGLRRNHDACKEQPSTAMALGMHQVRPHRNYERMKKLGHTAEQNHYTKLFCGKWYGVKIMTILRIEHAVRNFDAWKKTFDSAAGKSQAFDAIGSYDQPTIQTMLWSTSSLTVRVRQKPFAQRYVACDIAPTHRKLWRTRNCESSRR